MKEKNQPNLEKFKSIILPPRAKKIDEGYDSVVFLDNNESIYKIYKPKIQENKLIFYKKLTEEAEQYLIRNPNKYKTDVSGFNFF